MEIGQELHTQPQIGYRLGFLFNRDAVGHKVPRSSELNRSADKIRVSANRSKKVAHGGVQMESVWGCLARGMNPEGDGIASVRNGCQIPHALGYV
jgi:hypothetical protein